MTEMTERSQTPPKHMIPPEVIDSLWHESKRSFDSIWDITDDISMDAAYSDDRDDEDISPETEELQELIQNEMMRQVIRNFAELAGFEITIHN